MNSRGVGSKTQVGGGGKGIWPDLPGAQWLAQSCRLSIFSLIDTSLHA